MLISARFWNFCRSMGCEHKLHLNPSSKEALLITLEALQPIKITPEYSNVEYRLWHASLKLEQILNSIEIDKFSTFLFAKSLGADFTNYSIKI